MRVEVLSANLNGRTRGAVVEMGDADAATAIRERLAVKTDKELTPTEAPAVAAPAAEPEPAPRTAAKKARGKRAAKKGGG